MKSKRKGFTLVELIIVLAILAILMAVVVPSWGYFIRRSRERTANAKAKVVFNAAQTEFTRIAQRERRALDDIARGNSDEKLEGTQSLYVGTGSFYFYWDGTSGGQVDNNGNSVSVAPDDADQHRLNDLHLTNAINNICGTDGVYKIFVNNYNVQSVVYSNHANGNYKGTYPRTMGSEQISNEGAIRDHEVKEVNMNVIALNPPPATPEAPADET